ncbi:MAG: hypothetical protein R2814_18215 [Flavobacteriaceae bacterium]
MSKKPFRTTYYWKPPKTDWDQKWKTLHVKSFYDMAIPLSFLTNENLVNSNHCHITSIRSDLDGSRTFDQMVLPPGKNFVKGKGRTAINPDPNGTISKKQVTRPKVS